MSVPGPKYVVSNQWDNHVVNYFLLLLCSRVFKYFSKIRYGNPSFLRCPRILSFKSINKTSHMTLSISPEQNYRVLCKKLRILYNFSIEHLCIVQSLHSCLFCGCASCILGLCFLMGRGLEENSIKQSQDQRESFLK